MDSVAELLRVLFYTSLKTEEGRPVTCEVVWMDPGSPDPAPPERVPLDRWQCTAFAEPILLSVSNLAKVAMASDRRSSALAVYPGDDGKLRIWGMVDQGNQYHDFVSFECNEGPERPGVFQASAVGTGHLVVCVGYDRIGELRGDSLDHRPHEVFSAGSVRDLLWRGPREFISVVAGKTLGTGFIEDDVPGLEQMWFGSLCRLLLRIQGYRHGGAVLIDAGERAAIDSALNVRYRMAYDRVAAALIRRAVHSIHHRHAQDAIDNGYVYTGSQSIPTALYHREARTGRDLEECEKELHAALWFVSLLSRVDGLVLLEPDLSVRGFGVEVRDSPDPPQVWRASDPSADPSGLVTVRATDLGMRHRSMFRCCYARDGSVGFVVSQDGGVRAVAKVGDGVILWDPISLKLDDFRAVGPDGVGGAVADV